MLCSIIICMCELILSLMFIRFQENKKIKKQHSACEIVLCSRQLVNSYKALQEQLKTDHKKQACHEEFCLSQLQQVFRQPVQFTEDKSALIRLHKELEKKRKISVTQEIVIRKLKEILKRNERDNFIRHEKQASVY